MVIRPEATGSSRAPTVRRNSQSHPGRRVDIVAIGSSLRLRAVTQDGLAFESIVQRHAGAENSRASAGKLTPGNPLSSLPSARPPRALITA